MMQQVLAAARAAQVGKGILYAFTIRVLMRDEIRIRRWNRKWGDWFGF